MRTADGGVASFDPTTATLTPVWPSAPGSAWEGAATFADHLAFAVRESGVAWVFAQSQRCAGRVVGQFEIGQG